MKRAHGACWYSPEELIHIGFHRSRVVMMNEAHDGYTRCVCTRKVGARVLSTAHDAGVRHLAMEALFTPALAEEINRTRAIPVNTGGYLDQPEMRAFVHAVLSHGWTLIAYEADITEEPPRLPEQVAVNWREREQAVNLAAPLRTLPPQADLLVWCGNGHLRKTVMRTGTSGRPWTPMAYLFSVLTGIAPFVIDQTITVRFPGSSATNDRFIERYGAIFAAHGGAAGFLRADIPWGFRGKRDGADAWVLSTENDME